MELFTTIFTDLDNLNEWKNKMMPSIEDTTEEEWVALMGRYGSSHVRYNNRYQFMAAFFTILREAQEKLRIKLKVNTELRSLGSEDALEGDEVITNTAVNPDTNPATDAYEALPYVNSQVAQKGKLGKVRGLYSWKHSVGGQAYNEFLDAFKGLFRVVLSEEVTLYGQRDNQ